MTPDQIRTAALRQRLHRTLLNVSGWWGITPECAITVLAGLQADLAADQRAGKLAWPDPAVASYSPGMPDHELRALAYEGATALASKGIRPTGRKLWRWCRQRGARKREADAVRIVGGVVASLCAGEVAAAFVRGNR